MKELSLYVHVTDHDLYEEIKCSFQFLFFFRHETLLLTLIDIICFFYCYEKYLSRAKKRLLIDDNSFGIA